MKSIPDFSELIDRRGGDSIKWNRYRGADVLPMWVADMDFSAPSHVLEVLRERVNHGVFGYAEAGAGLEAAVIAHLQQRYAWQVQADWLVWLPGLVTGLNLACRTAQGGVLTTTPIYPPFLSAPRHSSQGLAKAPLGLDGAGCWYMDWDALEAAIQPDTRLLLLCHPHNPVGRVWRKDELERLGDLVLRHDLLVCSDEIHCDLILEEGLAHFPFAMLGPEMARRTITLMAPSKTFNVPGLGCAFAVIPDPNLRKAFHRSMAGIVPHVNVMGLVACEAAYRHGEPWRQALLKTLRGHRQRVVDGVAQCRGLRMNPGEATYLAWIDARGLGLENPARHFEAHGLGLSDGAEFGAPGWVRLNFGCPLSTLELGLQRLQLACESVW